ncbi:signal peptidase I [Paenibacillus glycanilyticus]|uniref:Signal peptidase I n=1 Tax=Paenibacillus glycanilyticus TaxID=126569 RepID=A0ABQ6G763_9BACL|nr:signal peptidase I [Paenibacillus glycanilyticus]GLX66824.1 hypothetical protein MU1_11680 [Paenibacillus glycanilyticus]
MGRRLFCILALLLASGCTADTVKDTVTQEKLEIIKSPSATQEKLAVHTDSMLNNTTYNPVAMGNDVYVDKTYYKDQNVARGDIVLYKTGDADFPLDYGRIIGLPEEEVNLKDGRIYINSKKLEAFYASEFSGNKQYENHPTSMRQPVGLEAGQYFVLGDYWQRSFHDSQTIGPIVRSTIVGKVVGWEGPKQAWDYEQGIVVGIEDKEVAIVREITANELRASRTDQIMGDAFPEAIWIVVDHHEEIQALQIGDTVKYELTGKFFGTSPIRAKGMKIERIGNIFEQDKD